VAGSELSPREIAALISMSQLLAELGFAVNQRTRRCACILHGGSNGSAFSWTETGLWKCHSCGAGGDRIALVVAVKKCSFSTAVEFLAAIVGLDFRSRRVSQREATHARRRREQAEHMAWRIADEIGSRRRYYTDGLHRTERLRKRIGDDILRTRESERDAASERLAQLTPVGAFFFAAWNFVWDASPRVLVRFALASPTDRRRFILEGDAG